MEKCIRLLKRYSYCPNMEFLRSLSENELNEQKAILRGEMSIWPYRHTNIQTYTCTHMHTHENSVSSSVYN